VGSESPGAVAPKRKSASSVKGRGVVAASASHDQAHGDSARPAEFFLKLRGGFKALFYYRTPKVDSTVCCVPRQYANALFQAVVE